MNLEEKKEAARKRAKAWYQANKARANASSARWNKANPEKRKEIVEKYNSATVALRAQRSREWSAANPELAREVSRRYRKNNPEASRKSKREWKEKNPERVKELNHRKRARRRGADGTYTPADVQRIYKDQDRKCAYCRTSLRGKYEIDHINPLASGGCNNARNIQLLCRNGCNQSKGSRDPLEFARSLGFLL